MSDSATTSENRPAVGAAGRTGGRRGWITALIAATALAAAVLAGCGGDGDNGGGVLDDPDPTAVYCPVNDGGEPLAGAFDAKELVGLDLSEAEAVAAENDCSVRVTFEEGVGLPSTMDFSPNRINVFIEGGQVTEIDNVG